MSLNDPPKQANWRNDRILLNFVLRTCHKRITKKGVDWERGELLVFVLGEIWYFNIRSMQNSSLRFAWRGNCVEKCINHDKLPNEILKRGYWNAITFAKWQTRARSPSTSWSCLFRRRYRSYIHKAAMNELGRIKIQIIADTNMAAKRLRNAALNTKPKQKIWMQHMKHVHNATKQHKHTIFTSNNAMLA